MAYDNTYLQKDFETGVTRQNFWSYDTLDTAATCDTAAYGSGTTDKTNRTDLFSRGVRQGDMIFRRTWTTGIGVPNGGTIATAGWHLVITCTATTSDLSDTLAQTVTNTD